MRLPLWFLPVVPVYNRKVEELRSQGVEERLTKGRPQPLGRRPGGDGHSSTSRLLNFSTPKFREQSENVYENKGQGQKDEQSRCHGVEELGSGD